MSSSSLESTLTEVIATAQSFTRTMFWSAESGHSIVYPDWRFYYEQPFEHYDYGVCFNFGRKIFSLSSKNGSKVQRRPTTRILGVSNDEIALHVLFTDALGFLSVDDLKDVIHDFSNTVFPEQIIENGLCRIMDIRSMYSILAGLVRFDESLTAVTRSLDYSHYSSRAASLACSMIELLYCNKVRIGFDSSHQMFSLCASNTLHPHEIFAWSVYVRGSYLNSKIDESTLPAGKGAHSIIGAAYYMNSASEKCLSNDGRGVSERIHEDDCNVDVAHSAIRISIAMVRKNSLVYREHVEQGCFVICKGKTIYNCDELRWSYSFPGIDYKSPVRGFYGSSVSDIISGRSIGSNSSSEYIYSASFDQYAFILRNIIEVEEKLKELRAERSKLLSLL